MFNEAGSIHIGTGSLAKPILKTTLSDLNRQAYEQLKAEKQLAIVPGATHLFEEPGTLQQVARLAAEWFGRYLGRTRNA